MLIQFARNRKTIQSRELAVFLHRKGEGPPPMEDPGALLFLVKKELHFLFRQDPVINANVIHFAVEIGIIFP